MTGFAGLTSMVTIFVLGLCVLEINGAGSLKYIIVRNEVLCDNSYI